MNEIIEKVKDWICDYCDPIPDSVKFDNPEKPYYVFCEWEDGCDGGFFTEGEAVEIVRDSVNRSSDDSFSVYIYNVEDEVQIEPSIEIYLTLRYRDPSYQLPNHLYESLYYNNDEYPSIRKLGNSLYIITKHNAFKLKSFKHKVGFYNRFSEINKIPENLKKFTTDEFSIFIIDFFDKDKFEDKEFWRNLNNLDTKNFIKWNIVSELKKIKVANLRELIPFFDKGALTRGVIREMYKDGELEKVGQKAHTEWRLKC